jgi:general secretion pathway protein J
MKRKQSTSYGMTLLELLVVLMLVSMLSTLLMQGVGFFLGKYETVQRVQKRISETMVRRLWFVESVKGVIPHPNERKRFEGGPSSFTGTSIQALASEPGRPVLIKWVIDVEKRSPRLMYHERGKLLWEIMSLEGEQYSFQYADRQFNWYKEWPQDGKLGIDGERIPHAIKLLDAKGETYWFAHLPISPHPLISFKQE